MVAKIEDFIAAKEAQRKKEKDQALIDLGLYEKVYAPGTRCNTEEYPFWDFDVIPNRRYKKVALDITEEEYEKLKAYLKK